MITTIQQGAFTTIQDQGRWGYQAYGMPIAGSMDRYASSVANLLVGNKPTAAVLEMTACGGAFKFDEEQLIAICGGDMQGTLNGVPIANWSSFLVPKSSQITFDKVISGYRTYLAVAGGFDVPIFLGSRSTYTRGQVGGYEGRALRQGDVLYVGKECSFTVEPRKLECNYIPQYPSEIMLRVILGPQDGMFSQSAIDLFLESTFIVTEQAGRMGYRLKGAMIKPIGKADIVSDAMCLGAIQISANSRPFIMTADHQTTGGFAKIGTVIWTDLAKLAQAQPGDIIRFKLVTEQEAIETLCCEKQCFIDITNICRSE